MKVDAPESQPAPEKQAPDGARFRKALQEADSRRPAPTGGAAVRAPGAPGRAPPAGQLSRPLAPASTARAAGPVLATARGALASPENLTRTRQVMHVEAQRLGTVRGEASTHVQERNEHRLTDLIARELSRDPRATPPPLADARSPSVAPPPETRREGMDVPFQEGRGVAVVGPGGSGAANTQEVPAATRAEAALELIQRIEVFVKSQRPALSLSLRGGLEATVEVERTGPREVALRIQGHRGPVPTEDVARLRDALEARGLRLRSLHAQ
ncbi:hypothetical protein [Pyxidicoccus xibeiensis]|uniref:hypothetical protein n=1 Tax=Pyxidicoccus xibeiensis TaxID=2906759 RepID=UPI0020A82491|nr:hypothetical protein [Pyxidicoccus xibeiensis]MCP3142434.1 hypothetical protein [Pyxidicoccus xibeiensis]